MIGLFGKSLFRQFDKGSGPARIDDVGFTLGRYYVLFCRFYVEHKINRKTITENVF